MLLLREERSRMRVIFLIGIIMLSVLGSTGANRHPKINPAGSETSAGQVPAQPVSAFNDSISAAYQEAHNTGTLADFPRLHPLVVHFPIVFIILALVVQIISFFVFKRELSWVALFLIVFGFIGAYVATHIFHGGDPDLSTLSDIARRTFEKHEQYAHYTEWMSGIAAGAKIISHFFLHRKLWTGIVVALCMLGAVYSIHTAGEMGARLVHIDAIGVQGHKIPIHDTD